MLGSFRTFLLFLFAAALSAAVSSADAPLQEITGKTMGTSYCVKIAGIIGTAKKRQSLADALQAELDSIDNKMSTYKPESEVCRFNAFRQVNTWFPVSPQTAEVVQTSIKISKITDGAFDITVAPLVDLWGFGAKKTNKPLATLIAESAKLKERIGYQKLSVRMNPPALKKTLPDLSIDLSAVAKGYAVDKVSALLDRFSYKNYMIEVGGEIRCRGQKIPDRKITDNDAAEDWVIGIEKPVSSAGTEVQTAVPLRNKSMATSGNYRQQHIIDGKRVSHFIDPRTGLPAHFSSQDLERSFSEYVFVSVSVITDDCMTADAWATALSVLSEQESGALITLQQGLAVLFIHHSKKGTSKTGYRWKE
ncbi:MAG: FAD:protein FMN transferase [Planctomycetaceae bacterium]|jgi:thiamine biosynthesis lipoprotein|nr:FAD:protein FMN transferase [Planctomycetaceae bacterium]